LVGQDFCVALIEEYGRWPLDPKSIAGKLFSWDHDQLINGKLPIEFIMVPGVEEITEVNGMEIVVVWQDLEIGMSVGLKASAMEVISPPMSPVFIASPPLDSIPSHAPSIIDEPPLLDVPE